ncbi:uncharacterized protein LOC109837148 [Asparagus officinalis]|uniref:uncharacterized protein LOC109837148 n=1 Tax=Asparagus officinalis TaxID=4686 RepID=UPI00098E5661|nr:uncharacterized protein LOC109837148 [Asparagus officinalis]
MYRNKTPTVQSSTSGNAPSNQSHAELLKKKRSHAATSYLPYVNSTGNGSGSNPSTKRTRLQTSNQECQNSVADGLNSSSTVVTTERTTTGIRVSARLQQQSVNDQPVVNTIVEERDDNVMSDINQEPPSGTTKKVRGKTRGVNADKVFSQLNSKIPVTLTEENGRPTGPYAEMFANEIGYTIRNYAPTECWKKIEKAYVENLIKRMQNKFEFDMSLPWVQRYVITTCQTVYCNFRYKLKKHFEQFSTIEEAIQNKHEAVKTQEEWEFLCTHFSSEKFKIRSEKNVLNRSKLTYHHKAGSKSFMSHQEQIDQMIKMRADTTQPDGTRTMTDEEICAKVLKVKSGYIKGCGFGPRPPPLRFSRSSMSEMSEKNKELQEQLQETQQLVGTQQQKIDAQNEVIQRLEEQAKKFEEFMANFSRQHPSA